VAELVFFSGTMDCGKSTLALQMDYNHRARGRGGVRFSHGARMMAQEEQLLPFEVEACLWRGSGDRRRS
jgi:hypothetical protein